MGATRIAKTISRTHGCGLSSHQTHALSEWHIRKHGVQEIQRKELRLLQPNCTNTCESECDQQRALVDRLPNARLRARCASLQRGSHSRRQLQGGRSETSTHCQGRRNGNGSVTVYETLPAGACNGLWCPCAGGSDCKAPSARQSECRGGRSLANTFSLQIPNRRTLVLDGTEGLQDNVKVLPSLGSTEREVLPSCDGCTLNNRRKINSNCGNGAKQYNPL